MRLLLPSVLICVTISVCYSAADSMNNGNNALEEEDVYTKQQFLKLLKEQGLHLEKDKIFNDNDIEYSGKNGRMGSSQKISKSYQSDKTDKPKGFFGFIEELITAVFGVISFVVVAIFCLVIGVIYTWSDTFVREFLPKQAGESILVRGGIFLLIAGVVILFLGFSFPSWILSGFILFIGCIFSCIFGGKRY